MVMIGLLTSNVAADWFALLLRIPEDLGSNLEEDASNILYGSSWFYSVSSGKYRDSAFK
jgi:hypothetical protein